MTSSSTQSFFRANKIAATIAQCDFRTTVSRYTTGSNGYPWVITVGESGWQRHLVLKSTTRYTAKLALLSADQSNKSTIDLDYTKVEREISLRELVAGGYLGVCKLLRPTQSKAA